MGTRWRRQLTAFTAGSIADSYRRYRGRVDEVLLSGGGARNLTLTHMIQVALPGAIVHAVDALLLAADAKEALAFAVAGYATSVRQRCRNHLGRRHARAVGRGPE